MAWSGPIDLRFEQGLLEVCTYEKPACQSFAMGLAGANSQEDGRPTGSDCPQICRWCHIVGPMPGFLHYLHARMAALPLLGPSSAWFLAAT